MVSYLFLFLLAQFCWRAGSKTKTQTAPTPAPPTSSAKTTLPVGSLQRDNRKGEKALLREEQAVVKTSRPVITNGDVEYQIKKAWAKGMCTYALSTQIKMTRDVPRVTGIGNVWRYFGDFFGGVDTGNSFCRAD